MKQYQDMRSFVEKLPFWAHLSDEEKGLVQSRQITATYHAGQNIRSGNGDCLGLVMLLSGVLRAHLISMDGRDVTLYRMKTGDICLFSATCVLDAISFETHVHAEQESVLLVIPADVYAHILRKNVYVERDTYKLAMDRFAEVVAGIERLVFLSLEQRIAAFLLDETREDTTVAMTHEQLAVNIGSAREAVSRTLKGMELQGILELKRGRIRLLNKPALYQMMG